MTSCLADASGLQAFDVRERQRFPSEKPEREKRFFLRHPQTIPISHQDEHEQCLAGGLDRCHIKYKEKPKATGNLMAWLQLLPTPGFVCPCSVEVPELDRCFLVLSEACQTWSQNPRAFVLSSALEHIT